MMWSPWRQLFLLLSVSFFSKLEVQCKDTRIVSLYACTDIKFRFATTRITSHVVNTGNQSRHAVFDITLPNDAFISNFSLGMDGRTYPGRVEERQRALRRYGFRSTLPEHLTSGGRVTQRRRETNLFRVDLKVGPMQSVTFNLTYQEILERRLGFYDHVLYIDPGQPVEDMRIDVSIEENREISYLHVPPIRSDTLTDYDMTETNSHVRVERPSGRHAFVSYHPSVRHQQLHGMSRHGLSGLFTVRYDVTRTMDAGEVLSVNGYFVHFVAPPVEQTVPKDVLFILDTSTSMMWEKLGQLQAAMAVILNDLDHKDRFALMQFNTNATFWRRELLPVTPRTIQWAMEYVQSLKARGYTNINSALAQGLDFFNKEETVKGDNSMIIFLTDGRPTRGETDRRTILGGVRAQNRKKVAVYGLAFGKDADWPLVKRLVSQNDGAGRRIYQDADAALQIQGFYAELSSLLLTDVKVVYLDKEVEPQSVTKTLFRKLFNGSELVVAGKLIRLNQTGLQILVQATGVKGQMNLTVVPNSDPLTPIEARSCGLLDVEALEQIAEKMWAYLTIRQTLQQRFGEDDPDVRHMLKEQATQLALKYAFVTPVTSLVVTKPGSDEIAFLQEDASDLLDETDILTAHNYTALANKTAGRSSRGGGGGDPHFMVEIASLPYPLCYDVKGDTGDVFRLLRDPLSGLTVNVEIGEGHNRKPSNSHSRFYITRAAILLQDIIMEVSTTLCTVNGIALDWNREKSVYLPGVWVIMTNSSLRFAIDLGVEIDVTRHVRNAANRNGENFLNIEVQHEARLSLDSSGLLGQFVHKDIRLQKLKRRAGRLVAEMEVQNGPGRVSHGRAVVKRRRDPFFPRYTACLEVGGLWSRTLDMPTRFYRVDSLFSL